MSRLHFNPLQKLLFFSGLVLVTGGLAALGIMQIKPLSAPNLSAGVAAASAYAAKGNYAAALKIYNRLIKFHPANGDLYIRRGLMHLRTGNMVRAQADFKQASRDRKVAAVAMQWSATAYSLKKDYANQEASASAAIAAGGENADSYALRGLARAGLGRTAEAVQDMTAAVAKNGNDAFLVIKKAELEYELRDFAAARASLARAFALKTADPQAYALLGRLEMEAGNRAKAIEGFEMAALMSDNAPQYVALLNNAMAGRVPAVAKAGKGVRR